MSRSRRPQRMVGAPWAALSSLLLTPALAFSASWYVRPLTDGPYGREDGTSHATAWRGLKAVKWGAGGVVPGDTLYICGEHVTEFYLDTTALPAGTPDKRITLDGRCPGEPKHGLILTARYYFAGGWTDSEKDGVYEQYLLNYVKGAQFFEDTGKRQEADAFVRLKRPSEAPAGGVVNLEPGSVWVDDKRVAHYKPTTGNANDHNFIGTHNGIFWNTLKGSDVKDHTTIRLPVRICGQPEALEVVPWRDRGQFRQF